MVFLSFFLLLPGYFVGTADGLLFVIPISLFLIIVLLYVLPISSFIIFQFYVLFNFIIHQHSAVTYISPFVPSHCTINNHLSVRSVVLTQFREWQTSHWQSSFCSLTDSEKQCFLVSERLWRLLRATDITENVSYNFWLLFWWCVVLNSAGLAAKLRFFFFFLPVRKLMLYPTVCYDSGKAKVGQVCLRVLRCSLIHAHIGFTYHGRYIILAIDIVCK